MTFFKVAPAVFGVALLAAAFSPSLKADEHDQKTTVTFSEPVEIPPVYITGMRVLPAGTYVFKLMNSSSNRHIVQIFNKDETKIYATILAIANYRLVPKDKTVITFNEGIAGQPEAIRAWFYPGANWGEEFVYPKDKAVQLAKVTNLPVPALRSVVLLEVAKPEAPQVVQQLTQAPIVAVQPTGEVVEVAQVQQPAPARTAPAVTVAAAPAPDKVLPQTASNLPLIALFGLLALAGGLMIPSIRKRAL
jgi:LPXTG-motif cell wall-anchored protein